MMVNNRQYDFPPPPNKFDIHPISQNFWDMSKAHTAEFPKKEAIMTAQPQGHQDKSHDLRCPECRARLKKRKTPNPDECEMVCGGCGQMFDVCDLETVEKLKK